jgi:peptidoglycan/xylan/chitin deacetylase (PgdA/CDA1 family)
VWHALHGAQLTRTGDSASAVTSMKISRLKGIAISAVATLGIQKWFGWHRPTGVTTLLFHSFFGVGESVGDGRERVKRMCDWLRSAFLPLSADAFLAGTQDQNSGHPCVFVTVDDARRRLLDVADIFRQFEIPLTVFVPVGWIDETEPENVPFSCARLVTALEHSRSRQTDLLLPDGTRLSFRADEVPQTLDRILSLAETDADIIPCLGSQLGPETEREQLDGGFCTWSELQDLAAGGVAMGSHSISHCRLAWQSESRIRYEVAESRRIVMERFGKCPLFAYPYGTWDVVSRSTTEAIRSAGYHSAFLVHAGFDRVGDRFFLPRIDIPDQALSDRVFRSLASGGQIPLIRLKSRLSRRTKATF